MRTVFAWCAWVAAAMTIAAPAAAAPFAFRADFEPASGYTSGAFPTVVTNGGGFIPGQGQDPWFGYFVPNGNGVIGQPAGMAIRWMPGGYSSDPAETPDPWGQDAFVVEAPVPSDPTNHAMAVVGNSSGGTHPTEVAVLMPLSTSQDFLLSLNACYPSAPNNGSTLSAMMTFMKVSFNFGRLSGYYGGHGNVCFQLSDGTCKDVAADEWHRIDIMVHQKTSTVDFSIDGVVAKAGVPVNLTGFEGMTKFNVWTDDPSWSSNPHPNQATLLLDDLEVKPVPTGMVLLVR
jgi:hypothetical protein